jgi:hypothetical protein
MSGSPLWSVKGVDDDTREIARRAAEASGLTIGAWIDGAIQKRTAPPEPIAVAPVTPPAPPPEAPRSGAGLPHPAVNGIHGAEAIAIPKPPPRFVRLVEDPLPPLEGFPPINGADHAVEPPAPRRAALPRRPIVIGAIAVVAIAAIWLAAEFVQRDEEPPPATASAPAIAPIEDGAPTAEAAAQSAEGAALVARLRAEAARGNTFAENDLGLLYATGRYVPMDEREAFVRFERAGPRASSPPSSTSAPCTSAAAASPPIRSSPPSGICARPKKAI